MYDEEYLDKPQAQRLLNAYNSAGKPKIVPIPSGKRASYFGGLPFIKAKIYAQQDPLGGLDNVIAELAHPLQDKYGNNNYVIEQLNPLYDSDDYRGKTRYDFPNKHESETHTDFQPLIEYYIKENILPGQAIVTEGGNYGPIIGNDEVVENPTFEQVMDSARVYNKRKQDMNYQYTRPISARIPKQRTRLGNWIKDLW
jgi:hypothetical protein